MDYLEAAAERYRAAVSELRALSGSGEKSQIDFYRNERRAAHAAWVEAWHAERRAAERKNV